VPREMGEETRKTTSRGCLRMIDDGGGESGTRSAANQDVPIADYNLGGLSCRPRDHRQASVFVLGLRRSLVVARRGRNETLKLFVA
jgi:hypothetical protein